jgi:RNA polymerase sigma-70 factor (ECF subfamily)
VAHNHCLTALRRDARRLELVQERVLAEHQTWAEPEVSLKGEVRDALLRMMFVCCDDALPRQSQLVFTLKVLSGFDVREIAERLFMNEANVYKRLGRARSRLRELEASEPSSAELSARLPAVQTVLYVMFTEGYLSSRADAAIRGELCEEAIRLTTELAEHELGRAPETFALLALMHLHSARMPARLHPSGGLILLEEQDRARWDSMQIQVGLEWLARSAQGQRFSRYHAEAGIAAEHCLAATFSETRWERVVACYELLETLAPSPLHTLNRALAVAQWQGPAAGLALLTACSPPSWLEGSHLWSAALADLHGRAGNEGLAAQHRRAALDRAPSAAMRSALERRLSKTH